MARFWIIISLVVKVKFGGGICLTGLIRYIQEKYDPLSVIVYGSYADGSNDANSDFDALVISDDHEQFHDTSVVNGVPLDVFVYPASFFEVEYACDEFVQIFDGQIIVDKNELGARLQKKVQTYLRERPAKTAAEIRASVDWCTKMLERAKRHDCEGMFRWHWVLTDSLEIFCDIMQWSYFGPKKALKWMEEKHSEAFALYQRALSSFCIEHLEEWIAYLQSLTGMNG